MEAILAISYYDLGIYLQLETQEWQNVYSKLKYINKMTKRPLYKNLEVTICDILKTRKVL